MSLIDVLGKIKNLVLYNTAFAYTRINVIVPMFILTSFAHILYQIHKLLESFIYCIERYFHTAYFFELEKILRASTSLVLFKYHQYKKNP